MNTTLTCFKAYDIRGELGTELDESIAWCIGAAFADYLQAKTVVIGGDVRHSTVAIKQAVTQGLISQGCEVIDIGMVGTEQIYFATRHLDCDGGIAVTASHNPIQFNGMKLVRSGSRPISGDSGLRQIQQLAQHHYQQRQQQHQHQSARSAFVTKQHAQAGQVRHCDLTQAYLHHMLSFIDTAALSPLKLVMNAGNGAAGPIVEGFERLFAEQNIPLELIKLQCQPDGDFPNGVPNPLLPEQREQTAQAVRQHGADLGIAWDGDFDRCFLFDHTGAFIEGYYIVGLLAQAFLRTAPNAKVVHDPRLYWNTQAIIARAQGTAVQSKTGHAFIKERMRAEDAIYGGEMSAHHYFRDFGYCDSGMIPWLLICELISTSKHSLRQMVSESIQAYPSSGEINFVVADPHTALTQIAWRYHTQANAIDRTDGLSMSFGQQPEQQWRFNLRQSNTESLLRLNVESKGNHALMQQKTQELSAFLAQF